MNARIEIKKWEMLRNHARKSPSKGGESAYWLVESRMRGIVNLDSSMIIDFNFFIIDTY